MMTVLLEAEVDGERLSDAEIGGFFNLLATAGNETVTKLLATAFYWLDRFPGERRILAEKPEVIPNAVEEMLRFDPPSQYQGRTLTRDVELHGRVIPKDAKLMIVNGASGRDERRFRDPDRLDVRREIEFHLGFGYGRHICLGAFLARMESRVALEEFFRRWPEYGVPEDGVERMHSSNVRGLAGLVLEAR
jgi:cytochrome P450